MDYDENIYARRRYGNMTPTIPNTTLMSPINNRPKPMPPINPMSPNFRKRTFGGKKKLRKKKTKRRRYF